MRRRGRGPRSGRGRGPLPGRAGGGAAAPHRARRGGTGADALRGGAGAGRRAAGRHPGADRRQRSRRAAVPHPGSAPDDADRRSPGRGDAQAGAGRTHLARVGGAPGARPDPGGALAHRRSLFPRSPQRRGHGRRIHPAQPDGHRGVRPRGGPPGRGGVRARRFAGGHHPAGPGGGGGHLHRGWRQDLALGGAGPGLRAALRGRGAGLLRPHPRRHDRHRRRRPGRGDPGSRRRRAGGLQGAGGAAGGPGAPAGGGARPAGGDPGRPARAPGGQRRADRGGAERGRVRRRVHRAVPYGVPVSRAARSAQRGGALRPRGGRPEGGGVRTLRHLPDAGSRGRQAAGLGAHARRAQPGPGPALDPLFAVAQGSVQVAAAGAVPGGGGGAPAHPVPDDLGGGRAARGQGGVRRGLRASWPRRRSSTTPSCPWG